MNVYELIKRKRDGLQLSKKEIGFLIDGMLSGAIPDYQMAAFLMAVYFSGMSARECSDLTMAMTQSGEQVDLSGIRGFKVDKHSTGGVGDTTTLVLAPLVAASGGIVAKMTGRELGHTGGTVDKLESIPGMRVALDKDEFVDVVNRVHVSLISQTARLAPADQQLYALRNVTATVDSVPLIAASIMSKKLAAGSDGIVLDVKTGQGAFMQKYEDALELARTMVNIGEDAGRRMVALVTAMQQPLGRAIGNAIEVVEAIDTLAGNGPPDLVALVTELGGEMLLMSGVAATREAARSIIAENLANRKGLAKLAELIAAQGGDRSVVDHPDLLPQPRMKLEIPSETSGYVAAIDAFEVGLASRILGAGRTTKDGRIDPSIGIYLNKKIGDSVKTGETLAVLHSDGDNQKIKAAGDKSLKAYAIGPDRVEPPKLLLARITGAGIEEL
ncbi:MAG: thymidine phosphorylase [Deltaproteobacteria bacterium]|jgi:pyrimidine-nucleoside phosphorylase|nr:thymidine phosphorylase [Deltaproteobacteria bacterium]MBW2515493.1 thymidine phosphorylase [Deltaproteobacteria bacterium]